MSYDQPTSADNKNRTQWSQFPFALEIKLYDLNICSDLGQVTSNNTYFQHDSVQIKENRSNTEE